MKVHFIDVGQGNMVLIQLPNSKNIVCDCNITNENEDRVWGYLQDHLGGTLLTPKPIDIFINTHRDADHMRGIKKLESWFGINEIWDSGVAGTTTYSTEYRQYMELRREIGITAKPFIRHKYGDTVIRVMNGKNDDFDNANDQSLVIKLEYEGTGIMLAGDTSYKSWKDYIVPAYEEQEYKFKSEILLASHHGSASFFEYPGDNKNYYFGHLKKISPAMTIISVGDNDTHPHEAAVDLYEEHSRGSKQKNKIFTTRDKGTLLLTVKKGGGWVLSPNQKSSYE